MQVGDYVFLKEQSGGPLGKLILAEHKILRRKAALKQLSLAIDARRLEDFENKIACLATLEHPHLARLQNVRIEDPYCYFAYDWLSASETPCMNLQEYIDAKAPGEDELLDIFLQIASALDAIHKESVVHLGVKASNVLIDLRPGAPVCYLTDTGLSHLFPPQVYLISLLEACTKRMELSSFWESFHALAPEQKEGSVSYKSDVYAFGVLVYKSLMGSFPEGRFPMPSKLAGKYRYDWDGLLSGLLDPDPASRPATLVDALKNLSHSEVDGWKLQLKPGEIHRPQFDVDPSAVFQVESAIVRYHPTEENKKELYPIETPMSIIPGGTCSRGSMQGARDESPRHKIYLSPYAIDKHPVTNEQFARFLEAMGGEKDGNNNDMIRLKDSRIKRSGGKISIESGYAKHPVVGVSWYGATAYAKWVGKRLPTEAEWEIAAAGGLDDHIFPVGQDINKSQANFFSSDTSAVMSYPPSAYDLYDMAGNVYEWCSDWYDYHYYDVSVQEPTDPKGPVQGVYRVLRGGCWKSLKEDLRCSHRHRNNPGAMTGTYGFRCATDVQ